MKNGKMPNQRCEICDARPAVARVMVAQKGKRKSMSICDYHYRQLTRHQGMVSPFDSFLGEGGLSRFLVGMHAAANHDAEDESLWPAGEQKESVEPADAFSEQTIELLQRAGEKAHELRRLELDTEHLVYVLADTDVGAALLKELKLSPEDIRGYIDQHAPYGISRVTSATDRMTISPCLKKVFTHAFEASHELGHSYIGPEHLLIGLASVPDSLAGTLLRKYGVSPETIRQKAVKVIGKGSEDGRVETPTGTPTLDKFGRDLTALARQGKLDPVLGRAQEIDRTIEVLARRKKNNPVLIGEAGVGKTAIVEGLAHRIVKGEVPEVLRGRRLVEINLNSMVAGAEYRGEFEERVKALIDEVTAKKGELIVFIDEMHTIVGADQVGGEGGLDIANVLKPALTRGELNMIGATTLNEYQEYIEKDVALERCFQPVLVPEPTVEQTIVILRGLRDKLEEHHKVTFIDEAFVAATEMTDRYITNRFLPDKAIDVINRAAARVRIGASSPPVSMQELDAQALHLKREQDYATSRKRNETARVLEEGIETRKTDLEERVEAWQRKGGSETLEVTVAAVAGVVSKLTGIPVGDLTQEEGARLPKREERPSVRVIGQDQAVSAVGDAVRVSRAGLVGPGTSAYRDVVSSGADRRR